MSGRVAVIGAGPGGLTTAMILASKGLKVTVFEKAGQVGGRNASIQVGDTKHDVGPTMLMMKFVLDAVFKDTGRKSEDHIKFKKLNPMYRLSFSEDKFLDCYSSEKKDQMIKEMERVFPEDAKSYDKWLEFEMKRYKYTMPLLQKIYDGYPSLINMDAIKALPYLSLGRSVFGVLGDNFKNPLTKLSFSFQSKYLGMTPWECPGFFNLIPFVEHAFGVYHVEGGLSTISDQMAKLIRESGGEIRLNTGVKQLIIENGKDVKGLITENGEEFRADNVVLNADFGYAMSKLIPDGEKILSKWAPSQLPKKNFSCSTYMMYLAMDKVYNEVPHHTILFSDDYKGNMDSISNGKVPDDPSIYVRNAAANDSTLAPAGKSGMYVLVPVPNILKQGEEGARAFWDNEKTQSEYRQKVIKLMEKRLGMKDFESHIEAEKVITPTMWQEQRNIYKGAVFSLAHNFFQLLLWRPRNKFEELENLFIVGAGTHPGSGLPTIYESGRMASELICKRNGIPFERSGYVDLMDDYKIL